MREDKEITDLVQCSVVDVRGHGVSLQFLFVANFGVLIIDWGQAASMGRRTVMFCAGLDACCLHSCYCLARESEKLRRRKVEDAHLPLRRPKGTDRSRSLPNSVLPMIVSFGAFRKDIVLYLSYLAQGAGDRSQLNMNSKCFRLRSY